jgi:cation transport regulator ChaC
VGEKRVWVFFYGLFMDFKILSQRGLIANDWKVAELHGYDFEIASWGYLKRSRDHSVYGVIIPASHSELARLYDPATNGLPLEYFPESIMVETPEGAWRPALCYVATDQPPGPVNMQYVESMVELARSFAFPRWYIEHLGSFREHSSQCPQS